MSDGKMPSGFDYMRIALAVAVLLWHSAQMTYGTNYALDLWRSWLGFALQLILPMFFALSGFLVTSSLARTERLSTFLLLRIIRIYPALTVEVLLSAFILGPIVTSEPLGTYFVSKEFLYYMANMTGYIHYTLPGVFLENPLPRIVNTSLWTVPFELECYVLISILVMCGYMRSLTATISAFILCTCSLAAYMMFTHQSGTLPGSIHGRVLLLCFLAGSILFRLRAHVPYDERIAIAAFAASVFLFRFDLLVYIGPMFAAYFTIWLGLQTPRRTFVVSTGDYSYGTYLYAGPIQQTAAWLAGPSNGYVLNVLISLPVTICFALFSWHAIEKPFLRVKRFLRTSRPNVEVEKEAINSLGSGPIDLRGSV